MAENSLCSSVNEKYPNFPEDWEVETKTTTAKFLRLNSRGVDRAMFQKVIRRPLNADRRFYSQANFMESVVKSYSPNASICTCQQIFNDVSHSYLTYLSQILRNLGSRRRRQIKQWPRTNCLFTN